MCRGFWVHLVCWSAFPKWKRKCVKFCRDFSLERMMLRFISLRCLQIFKVRKAGIVRMLSFPTKTGDTTVLVLRMAHRKWKEAKQLPSMLPGPAVPGCCLLSFHILWAILSTSTVLRISHLSFKGFVSLTTPFPPLKLQLELTM